MAAKTHKKKRQKVTIILRDEEDGRLNIELKFSPHIKGDQTANTPALHMANEVIALIGKHCGG